MEDNIWSKIPTYLRIKKDLIDEITSGFRPTHSKLPTEEELCRQYEVARGTVRQALTELSNDGYIYKVHGKGTFVKPHAYEHVIDSSSRFISFLDDLIDKGVRPSVQVLSTSVGQPSEAVAKYLAIPLGEDTRIYNIRRIRTVDNQVIMYSNNRIPCYLYPNMLDDGNDFISLYATLKMKRSIQVDKGTRLMQAIGADEEISKLMNIKKGSPVMHVKQIVYDSNGVCADCADIWLRSEFFCFTVNMRRMQA